MFHVYYNSIVGTKHDICEDYSKSAEFNDCLITVIADGVGSSELSDIGAKVISDTVIKTFSNGYNELLSESEAILLLKDAYISAYDIITDTAKSKNKDKYCYDSTLSCVVITSKYVIWGHCGDGAIFKINSSGFMSKITCEQTGDFLGEVYAFLSGEKYWSFGNSSLSDTYAFIMSTDGILEFLNLVLADPSDKFIYNVIQQIQKRNFESDVCNDLIKQILNLKTITDITRDDKTLAIILDDKISIKPSKETPNPIIYLGINNYYINYEDDHYSTNAFDVIDINTHNFVINEKNSKMITNVPVSNRIDLMQLIYPLRDVEIVLDPSNGTKNAVQLVHYIITQTAYNYNVLCNEISGSEIYKNNKFCEYYNLDSYEIRDNRYKDDFLIEELNNFNELVIRIYLFRDYFLFDLIIPDNPNLSLDFQMWSYSYLIANVLLKSMRSVKRNISLIPKPITDFTARLKNNFDNKNLQNNSGRTLE